MPIDHALQKFDYRVQTLQRLAQGGRWRTEAMRSHSQPLLYWFTRGQGRITVQGVTRGYGPHNAVFLPPGTMHGFEMMGHVFGTVLFFPRALRDDLPDVALHLRFREAQQQGEMTMQIDNITRELENPEADEESEIALRHHAGLLSVWLLRQGRLQNSGDIDPVPARAADRLAAAYTALLERDFRSGKGVAQYAADLGVTPTHLSRSCKATCGRSASKLLHDRLLYEARRMLRETGKPVKDVASDLGFRSAAYFTRAFQHRTGVTPTAFRREGRH